MPQLEGHRSLIADQIGQLQFREAIREAIRSGDTVLDLGTGTGLHAIFACQAGAKRVYAVEESDIIEVARALCRANGCEDRVTFIAGNSFEIDLPERVDLIVTNQGIGSLLRILPNAKDRFLKPGGRVIPRAIEFFVAPVDSPKAYEESVGFWELEHFGLRFEPFRPIAVNTFHHRTILPEEPIGEASRIVLLDPSSSQNGGFSGSVQTEIVRTGRLHGIGLWTTHWLGQSSFISNAPPLHLPPSIWPHFFLSVAKPVDVGPGDKVQIDIQHSTPGENIWSWQVRVEDKQGGPKAEFRHSSFSGKIVSRESLRRQALDHAPRLTPRGEAERFVLECCDGSSSLASIEEAAHRRFPQLFKTQREAAAFVTKTLRDRAQ